MTYQLLRHQWIPAPRHDVFEFFSQPENLGRLTPPWLGFDILTPFPLEMREGATIEYTIRFGPVPMRWRTRIVTWVPEREFVDVQERGPYRQWVHRHTFRELEGGTLMTDRVRYVLPAGVIGRAVHAVAVRGSVNQIFDYRFDRVEEWFGSADTPAPASRTVAM